MPWRRERLPTSVFWPEESHGLYSPRIAKNQIQLSDFPFTSLFTEELYKKYLNDPDNHDGVITYLECEVKWVLGSITTNKASRPRDQFMIIHVICA